MRNMKSCTLPIVQILLHCAFVDNNAVVFTNEPCRKGRRLERLENNQFRYKFCGPAGYFWIYDCLPTGTVFSSFYQKCLPVLIPNLKSRDDGYKINRDGDNSTVTRGTSTIKSTTKIATVRLLKLYTVGNTSRQPVYKAPPQLAETSTTVNIDRITVAKYLGTVTARLGTVGKKISPVTATTAAKSHKPATRTSTSLSVTSTTAAKSPPTDGTSTTSPVTSTTTAKSPPTDETSTPSPVTSTTAAKSTTTTTKYKAKEPVVFVPRDLTAILDMMGDDGRGNMIVEDEPEPPPPKIFSSNRRLVALSSSKNPQIEAEKRFLERLRILKIGRTLG